MITNPILSYKQVKALKAYYRDSNKQFAEWTTVGTQAVWKVGFLTSGSKS
jgi:hypothetical protein